MTINQDQKDKYLEYLERKGLPKPSAQVVENNLLDICIDDLIVKIKEVDPDFVKNYETTSEEIRLKLAKKIFNEGLVESLGVQSEVDPEAVNDILSSKNFDDMILKVGLYSQQELEFASTFTIFMLASYLKICGTYKIKPDLDIFNLFQFLTER
jgi:hypothetical protein